MLNVGRILLGWLLGIVVATAAYRAGALDRGGALAAAVIGGIVFGVGGWPAALLLLLFFLTSSALSRLWRPHKRAMQDVSSKGERRDFSQVVANGVVPAALCLLSGILKEGSWFVGLAGALAASTADTWATELGVLSKRKPRLITTGAAVETGTSGAVSLEGSLAAITGAGLIGLAAGTLNQAALTVVMAFLGGIAGVWLDSLLGATLQVQYFCPTCNRETEQHPQHRCGSATAMCRGWRRLNNDGVNLSASVFGAVVAMAIHGLL